MVLSNTLKIYNMKIRVLILVLFCITSNAYSQNKDWLRFGNKSSDTIPSEEVVKLKSEVDSLKSTIESFSAVRNWMEKHLIDNYSDYHARSFSELDTCLIDSLVTICRSVQYAKLDTLAKRLDEAKTRLRQYVAYNRLIEIEYDSIAIDLAQKHIDTILIQCSDIQKEEFNELLGKLELEAVAITELYNIVYEITYRVERYRLKNDNYLAVTTVDHILKSNVMKYNDYISKIPYTDSLYLNYKKAILEKPLEVSEYEEKILRLSH